MKKMHKVYIELTSKCGLSCDFCPSVSRTLSTMEIALFKKINRDVKAFTNDIAYHVVGDPLLVENIREYLDISHEVGLNVHITTAGYYLKPWHVEALNHLCIKQINFSLSSYRGNKLPISLETYIENIANFTLAFRKLNSKSFINYRLWNIEYDNSQDEYNQEVRVLMASKLGVLLSDERRLMSKVLFNFDELFEWPSLNAPYVGDKGSCHGLSGQMAILSTGEVVPCCFDYEAIINLGNLKNENLVSILQTPRAKNMIEGFKKGKVVEDLCQHCSYRTKF